MDVDISKVKHIHFTGIKGIAMTALAVYAKERGYTVTGCDTKEEFPSDEVLASVGIKPLPGFSPDHVDGKNRPDVVIYTGAHSGRNNPEVVRAKESGIPVLAHGQALGLFMNSSRQISVAGSHGKSTTTAMIATILHRAGSDPSYAIGSGMVKGLGLPGHFGKGLWFVAEADEYVTDPEGDLTPRFLWQNPEILVLTNIDFDHPDVYGSIEDVKVAFQKLVNKLPHNGELVVNADDAQVREMLAPFDTATTTVGTSSKAGIMISGIHFTEERTYFSLENQDVVLGEFMLGVPGKHNVHNAALAAIATHAAGVDWKNIRVGLSDFGGAKRRFEKIAVWGTTIFYDDYAHHPAEIIATLSSARAWYPKRRIIGIFQPHTYSRTKALMNDFAGAFSDADIAITTDIYPSAREHNSLGITGVTLAQLLATRHIRAHYARTKNDVSSYLRSIIRDGDVVVFMGAGDIYQWGREIITRIKNKEL